ncbi:MAG TPA: DNA polymerase IV, partial [Halanaerobiales bacterium]|nr:DNA polymerase IV [Halanaerobiales bacterium]
MSLDIMHIDMDAFFASVEQLDNPDISGKQVIVGGLGKRGVVSTASYEARKYGVHSAMPMTEARKLCPEGIFISGRHKRYAELSGDIYQIFKNYTPLVEKVSIDEAFLDLKGCHRLFGNSVEIGKKIKKEIKNKTGLTASAGLAPNKFLAKLASDMDKPDGFFVIEEDRIAEILEPLSVNKMWGVGKKATKVLKNKGISTVGQLKKLSLNELSAIFDKMGIQLYYLSRGIDNRSVSQDDEIKSISHEETYSQDLKDREEIYQKLLSMAERVSRRMRKKGYKGNTIF